ncbi:MAG: MmcQ/YjbR family DNA-binding protein [Mycobacteriales bacterium]
MAHPKMYEGDDPYLAALRAVCLAFPESTEVEAWGRPTFRAGPTKMFAVFGSHDRPGASVLFKPDAADRRGLVADNRFFSPPYFGPSGWLALDLSAAPVDWTEVAELMDASYRQVALKRMLKVLDGGQK